MSVEYIIYCDESEHEGMYYSNFYGGLLVQSPDLEDIIDSIASLKRELHLYKEVKWQKVTENYLEKYKSLMALFFSFVRQGKLKARIMFTKNNFELTSLEEYHEEYRYFLLYYQFIKHAFGLQYSNNTGRRISLRIYFDKLPDTDDKREVFKDFIFGLNRFDGFRRARITIKPDQIAEVDSHNHDLLQCIDIVLGSMQFRLNDKHKVKKPGSRRRGKRTIAKEKLYKFINAEIRKVYPNFNIGISTGAQGDRANYWRHPYRHWLFVPRNAVIDHNISKNK